MKKNKKIIIAVSLTVAFVLIVPIGIAVAMQISDNQLYWTKPPYLRADNESAPIALESYDSKEEKLFDDEERDHCLGYLDYYKEETVTGSEATEEAKRIKQKNTLIQEYKLYVNSLYNQVMTIEEYEAHYEHLMDIVSKLLPLEPERTPEEQLAIDVIWILQRLDEDLYYCEFYGDAYINDNQINVAQLKQSIAELTALQEKLNGKQLTFEQAQRDYTACLEVVKTASPQAYSSVSSNE